LYQRFQWNFNWWQYWTTAGLPEERAFNTNTHTTFGNQWSLHFGGTVGQLGTTYCYACARGGPAVRQDSYVAPWLGINGDDRKAIVPYVWFNWFRGDGGGQAASASRRSWISRSRLASPRPSPPATRGTGVTSSLSASTR